jgi:hypothetical protein
MFILNENLLAIETITPDEINVLDDVRPNCRYIPL